MLLTFLKLHFTTLNTNLEQDRGLPLRLASRQATATLTEHQTATPSPQHPRCPRASVQENKKKKVYNTLKQRHVS